MNDSLASALATIQSRMQTLREELAQLEQAEAALRPIVEGTPPPPPSVEPPKPAATPEPEEAVASRPEPAEPGKRVPYATWADRAANFLRANPAWDAGISGLEKALGMGANTHGRKIVNDFKDQGLITTSMPARQGEPTRLRWVGGDRSPKAKTAAKRAKRGQVGRGQSSEAIVKTLSEQGTVGSQKELAELSGVAYGSVHQILVKLEREGRIEFERQGAAKPVKIHWKGNGTGVSSGQLSKT